VSLQFSRSLRSLKVDGFRASRIGLILAILLMVALIFWFFSAKVTLYESSSSISLTEDGHLLASFTPNALRRIQPGQPGVLRLDAGSDQRPITTPVTVFDLPQDSEQVEFLVQGGNIPPDILAGKIAGQVEVEVEHITPAELVFRTSGKYFKTNQGSTSSQTNQVTQQP